MKKQLFLGGVLAALMAGAPLLATADEDSAQGAPGKDAMADGMGPGMMGGHLDKLKEKLGLTDDQAAKLKDLFKSQMDEMKPLRDQMKIDMDSLQKKVDTKASDGDIKKNLDALSADRDALQAGRKKMEDQVRQILNPTQQAKMVLGMQKMMGKWMGQKHHGWKDGGKDGGKSGSHPDAGSDNNSPAKDN